MTDPTKRTRSLTVLELRQLAPSTYVLKFERGSLEFRAGQYISLGSDPDREMREYSCGDIFLINLCLFTDHRIALII